MRGIYIYYNDIDKMEVSGIDKKVLSQVNLFFNEGLTCELITVPNSPTFLTKIVGRLPFVNVDPVWKYDQRFQNIDFLYFRRPFCMTRGLRSFLKKVKEFNPGITIVIEIPTYPYDQELMAGKWNLPLVLKDRYNRQRLLGLVDAFAVVGGSELKQLWGIPVIPFINGIEVNKIKPKKNMHKENEITLICVSTLEFWHGYDRLIKGLGKYYAEHDEKRKITLHVVGDGFQKKNYELLVDKEGLEKVVIFHGLKYGDQLDTLYDIADIAVECMGLYKKGVEVSSSLKSREYFAKGLPIVAGCKNDMVSPKNEFYLELPNNDTIININEIISFYDRIYKEEKDHETVIKQIRQYAINKIDMSKTMHSIIQFIKER